MAGPHGKAHKTDHQNGGDDQISLAGLSGEPADTVNKTLYDANTVLKADSNDTPAALTVAEERLVGRITAGVITALTPAQVRTMLDVSATSLDRCKAYRSAAQSTTDATWTPVEYNLEYYDTNTMHDLVTNNTRITIKTAGYYLVIAKQNFFSNSTGVRLMEIVKNGAIGTVQHDEVLGTTTVPNAGASNGTHMYVATIEYLEVSDYLELWIRQESNGALNTGYNVDAGAGKWTQNMYLIAQQLPIS